MSVVYQIESDGFLYEVVDDLAILYQAVFTGALLDETNGEPIVSLPVLSTDLEKLSLRSATGALIAGAAYVEQVFPKLATTSYLFHVDISAEGYQHTTLTVNVPAGTTFPITTAPVIMRRIPVRLQGKVVKDSDRSPLPLATVSSKSGKTPLLRDNVRSSHAAGTTVRSFSFTNLGAARKLSATALPGSTGVVLDNNAGLGANDFLQIGSDGSAQIYQVSGTGPAAGLVVLQSPLTATFPDGTAVQQLNPVGPSGNSTLARSSDPGDGLLVLATALSDSGIEIVDGAATEYHWLNAVSGTDGYYQADGIVAVAALELLCKSGVLTPGDQPWMPQYGDRVNVVDFRLRP